MPDAEATPRIEPARPYDIERVRGFSDCVFAVAITIVVITFVVPDRDLTNDGLTQFLAREWPRYLSYLGAFIVIGSVWLVHHRLFEVIERADGGLLFLNLVLLSFVVLVPYPMQLLGRLSDFPVANGFFALTALALGLAEVALVAYATWHHRLVNRALSPEVIRVYRWRASVLPAAFGIALLATVVIGRGALVGWALLAVGWVAVRLGLGPIAEGATETSGEVEGDDTFERAARLETESVIAGRALPFSVAYRRSGRLVRLLGFTDNVYAFAITLLVLQLHVPVEQASTSPALFRFLTDAIHPDFVGYFLGFAVVGLFWTMHHVLFLDIEHEEARLRIMNLVHLLFVAMMPFATLLLLSYAYFAAATLTFGVLALLVSGSLAGMYVYATSGRRLVDPAQSAAACRQRRLAALLPPAVYVVSLPFAVWAPALAQALWYVAFLGLVLARRSVRVAAPLVPAGSRGGTVAG